MKRYKLLKPLPGNDIGEIIQSNKINYCPELHPDFFQEIKETSDEEVFEQWLIKKFSDISINCRQWNPLVLELIRLGFNVASLKECEHDEVWHRQSVNAQERIEGTLICTKCGDRK